MCEIGRSAISGTFNGQSGTSGVLFDVKRFALHDGPGIRTTLFLKGCPLACAWCHNPESQQSKPELMIWIDRCVGCGACISACPAGAISLRNGTAQTDRDACTGCGACVPVCPSDARAIAGASWSVDRLIDEVEKDCLFYDESDGGITLSGGEPLAQVQFARAILSACRDRRIHTAVDTCGYAEWSELEVVAHLTDLFLYDLKHADGDRHRELTGVSNERILENLQRLDSFGRSIWIRIPVIPGVNDTEDEIAALGEVVRGLTSVEAVHLLMYHRGGEAKREHLGTPLCPLTSGDDPRGAVESAAVTLQRIVSVPVRVGG